MRTARAASWKPVPSGAGRTRMVRVSMRPRLISLVAAVMGVVSQGRALSCAFRFRLVAQDGPQVMRLLGFPQEEGVVPGRLHGVGGDRDAVEGQWLQQRPEVRDLVRLAGFRNLVLGDDQAGDVGDGGEQVHLLPAARPWRACVPCRPRPQRGGRGRAHHPRSQPVQPGMGRVRAEPAVAAFPAEALRRHGLRFAFPASLPSRAVRLRGARHTLPGSRDPAPSRRGPRTGRPRIRRGPAAPRACPAWRRTARRAARSAG